MNTTTTPNTPPPTTPAEAGINGPLVLVRSEAAHHPNFSDTFLTEMGQPPANRKGLQLLAEMLRLACGIPVRDMAKHYGELNDGWAWLECGPTPPGQVAEQCLSALKPFNLEILYSIFICDPREQFWRPYYDAPGSGITRITTFEDTEREAAGQLAKVKKEKADWDRGQSRPEPDNPS